MEEINDDSKLNANDNTGDVEMKRAEDIEPKEVIDEPTLENDENPSKRELNEKSLIIVDVELTPNEEPSSLFSCSICKTKACAKTSKILKCSHTVCANCVLDKVENNFISCGFCNEKTNVDDIEKHFLLEDLDESSNENQKCLLCDDNLIANHRCIECNDVMCFNCVCAHKRVKLTRDHQLTEMFKVTSLVDQCPTHKSQQLRWHCRTCDEITCPNCQLETHNGHDYQPAEDGITKFRDEISRGEQANDMRIETLVELTNIVTKRIEEVEECKTNMETALEESTSALLEAVNRRHARLLGQIVETCRTKRKIYEVAKKDIDELNSLTRHLKIFAESTQRCRNKLYVRRCASLLMEKFQFVDELKSKLIESTNFARDTVKISLKIRRPLKDLAKIIEDYGETVVAGDANQSSEAFQSRGCSPVNFPQVPADQGAYQILPNGTFVFNESGQSLRPIIYPLQQYKPPVINGNSVSGRNIESAPNSAGFDKIPKKKRKQSFDLESDRWSSPALRKQLPPSNSSTPNSRRHKPTSSAACDFEDEEDEEEEEENETEHLQNKKSQKSDASSGGVLRPLFQQTTDSNKNDAIEDSNVNENHESNEPKEWEEFCCVCQGDTGEFLKCTAPSCTRVFHRYDHIPSYKNQVFTEKAPFRCGFCRNPMTAKIQEDCLPKEKRKSNKMTLYERQVAERILLELFCNINAEPFINLPDPVLTEYYKAIAKPFSLSSIRENLESRYNLIEQFIMDLNYVFINCATFYGSETETFQKGKELGEFYKELMTEWLPDFLNLVDFSKDGERNRSRLRKRRVARDFTADTLSDSDSFC